MTTFSTFEMLNTKSARQAKELTDTANQGGYSYKYLPRQTSST